MVVGERADANDVDDDEGVLKKCQFSNPYLKYVRIHNTTLLST